VDGTNPEGKLTGEGELSRSPDDNRIADLDDDINRWSRPADHEEAGSPAPQATAAPQAQPNAAPQADGNGMPVAPQSASSAWSNAFTENFDPLVGQTLANRFEIVEILGSGGMSVVYKAKLTSVDKHVAIKTLNIRLQSRPGVRERFSREIETLAKLEHPHIVTVHDCLYGPGDQLFLVMDLLTGKSLDDTLAAEGRLSIERVRKIGIQICAAVKYAHQKGIIHRDLKPGNVMLLANEQDFVKVVDFGLVKLGEDSRRLTQSGEFWGSPPYVSPEQVKGEPCDARSDVYSLGCVLYEMLIGQDPFFGVELFQLLNKHVQDMPPRFAEARPDLEIPEEMEAIVFKALAKSPADRFQSMAEFQSALEKFGSGSYSAFPEGRLIPQLAVEAAAVAPDSVSQRRDSNETTRERFSQETAPSTKSAQYLVVGVIAAIIIAGLVAFMTLDGGHSSTTGDTINSSVNPDTEPAFPGGETTPASYLTGATRDSDQPNVRRSAPPKPRKAADNRRSHRSTKQKSEPKSQKTVSAPTTKPKRPASLGSQWDRLRSRRSSAAQE
jgi:Serine/threonine protein kinase